MSQYFDLFQIPTAFDIEESRLEQAYRTLASQFHPDRFASASSFEQKQAVMMSATVNEAYRTLRHPIDRAAYLLKEQGTDADAPEHTAFDPEFLMQQMEWRETLAEARMKENHAALAALAQEISAGQAALFEKLRQAFAASDFEAAAQSVRQGRFLEKLQKEINASA